MAGGSDTLKVHIAPGSTIKKAFLFGTEYWNNDFSSIDFNIQIDGISFVFDRSTRVSSFHIGTSTNAPDIYVHAIDISQNLISNDSLYYISIPNINVCEACIFSTLYLYILYENPNLNPISSYVLINNKDEEYSSDFQLTQLNKISEFTDIGWAVCASRLSEWSPGDGSLLNFNNGTIQAGLLQGEDNPWSDGPQGCFYFENDELFGLSNDTPDNVVHNGDAILNATSYLNFNNNMNWNLTWEALTPIVRYNIYNEFFIEHGTTCETSQVTTINDTTICANSPLQLYANGGIAYEWSPSENLSCSNCANPIFVSDSSQLITVRIWTSDSCSVVRPISVQVRNNPTILEILTSPSICATHTGSLEIQTNTNCTLPLTYQINLGPHQNTATFTNLSAGIQQVRITDGDGCYLDTVVEVEQVINTISDFSFSSEYGFVNEYIQINNNSINAENYIWSVDDTNYVITDNKIKFLNPGEYQIQLVSFDFDSTCTDTTKQQISIYPYLYCSVPNIITPNNDGINDFFTLDFTLDVECSISLLNRNGNLIFYFEGNLEAGKHDIWDGKVNNQLVKEGTYFYTIELKNTNKLLLEVAQKSLAGFFNVSY
jgi:gliding motility-associated-like protein